LAILTKEEYMATLHKRVPLYINGEFFESKTDKWQDVINPATQEKISEVPHATMDEMEQAVATAKAAFEEWKNVQCQLVCVTSLNINSF
jgi:delta 1-pyrroline-5-carboxylate dehydrogenase